MNWWYVAAVFCGMFFGYLLANDTVGALKNEIKNLKKEIKRLTPDTFETLEAHEQCDHLVEVRMETNDTYTYATVVIDGKAGGREKTFVSYMVRDAIKAHSLIVYDEAINAEGKSRLEAIGASRRDDVYLVAGRRYKFVFKQPVGVGSVGGMHISG